MSKSIKKVKSATQEHNKISKKIKDKLRPYVQKLLSKSSDVKVFSKRIDWDEITEMLNLIENIIHIEKPYTVKLPQREQHWDAFYTWCSENGAKFDNITFKEVKEGNFGAVAKSDIKENESFLLVPRKLMISELTAKASKLGPLIESEQILLLMPNIQIAMHIIMELLDPSSKWKPYISIMPSKVNTVLYFTLQELKELQGSPVLDEVIKLFYSVARQYCYFFQLFQSNALARSLNIGPYFTFELYRWAVSIVMTRQNFVPSPNGCTSVTSLVPLFDMCNHSNGKPSTDFLLEKDLLVSFACKSFSKGDEVSSFYGKRINGEYFVHNGFVYPENEYDGIEIKLGLGKSDPLLSLKKDLCEKLEVSVNGPFFIYKGKNIGGELLTFLKINVMKSDELQKALDDESDELSLDKYPDLQKRALSFLKDRIFLLQKCYKTTLEEDEEFIKTNVAETPNCHLALQLRICEKTILNEAHKYCVENTC